MRYIVSYRKNGSWGQEALFASREDALRYARTMVNVLKAERAYVKDATAAEPTSVVSP